MPIDDSGVNCENYINLRNYIRGLSVGCGRILVLLYNDPVRPRHAIDFDVTKVNTVSMKKKAKEILLQHYCLCYSDV